MSTNAKIIWLVSIILVGTVSFMAYKYYSTQSTMSTKDECFTGSIDACIKLVKENKEIVKKAELENIEANKKIESNLSGTDFKFNSEKLN